MQPRPKVADVAAGKWLGILAGFGLADRTLSGRHGPCPLCGGTDRFRFDDKEGRGTWFCSHCGSGDGVGLVMRLRDCDFKTAARDIEQAAGVVQQVNLSPVQGEKSKIEKLRRVWSESLPLSEGDEAARYLAGRGLPFIHSDALRLHSALPYHDGERIAAKYPALLARVVGPNGDGVTVHRTYLLDGRKAPVESPKKLMPGKPLSGAAVRLYPVTASIGIAEGIETALAASVLFDMPVWSCINANGVESFEPPDGVRSVVIFGDNDQNCVGQAAAYSAAKRLLRRGLTVDVRIPPTPGDWLDVLNRQQHAKAGGQVE